MRFKVSEILLVANLYDAYSIEKEGRFSEHVLGEYHQLNLTSVPRITGVSTLEEVVEQLQNKHFDMIIFMIGVDKKIPIQISEIVKSEYPYIQTFFLLNNNRDISFFKDKKPTFIDRIFVWNGDSKIFFAMIKHVEDKINVENDTRFGMVRVILLVEDSPIYYSRYLPLLYNIVLEQTKRIIDDVSTDELYRVLKLRARPKILLASNYEEAIDIVNHYKDYMLCLITDMKYQRNGVDDELAGLKLVKFVNEHLKHLPTIIQSSDPANAQLAYDLKCTFIDKNSESLVQDVKSFITHYLGFGNFIYRNKKGAQIAVARSLKDFEKHLHSLPEESLLYHARKDHFSLWLMARGEIQVARIINPAKVSDFDSPQGLREYMINVIQKFRNEQNKGKVIPFEETSILDDQNIVGLSEGALGGKGRGISFINTLVNNFDFSQLIPDINICTPVTTIIGITEFELFLDRNKLHESLYNGGDFKQIKELFVDSRITDSLTRKLKIVLKKIKKPIAVRSSGLFEDSLMQPFAGIFETYILPNSHADINVRLEQCIMAIKLVFASIFSKTARDYIEAIHYKIEEEKMAVVIQEVVGNQYNDVFYPHISGVAQSYNYYPFGHMKPEDGFAVAALGLGTYVVQGEKSYRFCPKYPDLEINSPKDQFKNSQLYFYAVDLSKKDVNLLEGEDAGLIRLDIDVAEKHQTLKHLASVYNADNQTINPGLDAAGPRIINFANILKYEYIPLANAIDVVLDVVKEAMGTPVEIEFAVDLNKDKDGKASFYLLQIKPLIGSSQDYTVDMSSIDKKDIILFTDKGMGNGIINNLKDIVYINYSNFDKSKTEEMAAEIEGINAEMGLRNKKYILIGPGRWGTRDKWIGIPVVWPQISNAKIIVETNFEDYPIDASSGSHFFHNLTSMNVGYFTVQQEYGENKIDWKIFDAQKIIRKGKYFNHIEFDQPVKVMMDGRKRIAVICK
ncbi:MAG: pyruvate, phosphate dikinase [Bacteroidetes bacterium]|nr:pyruvate, phosphate dikinase [Bacteroidota bacterium]